MNKTFQRFAAAAVVALAACSVRPSFAPTLAGSAAIRSSSAAGPANHIYLANSFMTKSGTVTEYGPAGTSRLQTIAFPATALAGSGGLIAAGSKSNIQEYAAGTNTVKRTITQGVNEPMALAFDGSGNLYAVNFAGSRSIVEYARGTAAPLRTISLAAWPSRAVAIDAAGNLYVGVYDKSAGDVLIYSPGQAQPARTIPIPHANEYDYPAAMLLDSAQRLYVATNYGHIYIYEPGATAPTYVITYPDTLNSIALDKTGNLWAVGNGPLVEYAATNWKLVKSIVTGGPPIQVGVDGNGNVYVGAIGVLEEYDAASGAKVRSVTKGVGTPIWMVFASR